MVFVGCFSLSQADRLLELGFQEEVAELVKSCPVGRQTLLFSATMNTKVDDLASLALNKVGGLVCLFVSVCCRAAKICWGCALAAPFSLSFGWCFRSWIWCHYREEIRSVLWI